MRNHTRFILSLAAVIICATPGLAQDTGPTPPHVFAHNAKIETSYDQVKDITTVRLNPMQIYGEPLASSNYMGGDEARFYVSFTYAGRTLRTRPKRVLLSLISTSEDWKYTDFRRLTAVVDGKPLKLGRLEHVPSFTVNAPVNSRSDDYIREEIAISLPLKAFLRIANGKRVRIRMGPREFKLGKDHLEALCDLANRMVPRRQAENLHPPERGKTLHSGPETNPGEGRGGSLARSAL